MKQHRYDLEVVQPTYSTTVDKRIIFGEWL